ncbi:MAG: helix-turn-helix domain-containing protein, partial [Calditrichaeota bacterium]|nr:helix-turn-helix domain-containing protein [Calditrichota bacterium]
KLNKKFNKLPPVVKVSSSCLKALNEYHWPGNVRELQNVIERSMIEADTEQLEESHLPNQVKENNQDKVLSLDFQSSLNLPEIIENTERTLINRALEKKHFNLSETAKSLHISRSTLYRKMEQYEIELPKNAVDND